MRAFSIRLVVAGICVSRICAAQGSTWGAGAAVGALRFSDGGTETAIGATISARSFGWLDFSMNPTWARATSAASGPIPARTVSGFTDLPLSVGVSRGIPGALSPSVGISLGITLPTGDTAELGSGRTNFGISASAGIAPGANAWFSASAGRSLTNGYSAALASSASTSVAVSAGTRAGLVQLSASLSGDVGPVTGYEPARSMAAGMALPVGAGMSLNLDGSLGLSSGSPTWAVALGFGTTPSGVVAASIAPYQRLSKAFGSGSKLKTKPAKP